MLRPEYGSLLRALLPCRDKYHKYQVLLPCRKTPQRTNGDTDITAPTLFFGYKQSVHAHLNLGEDSSRGSRADSDGMNLLPTSDIDMSSENRTGPPSFTLKVTEEYDDAVMFITGATGGKMAHT